MSDSLNVAVVQQQMLVPTSHSEYREDLRRFMRIAANRHARLVVFPELGGAIVMPPLLADFRSTLIKRAELGKRRRAGLWERLSGHGADLLAQWLKADLRVAIAGLLDVAASQVWEAYCETFSELAREFRMTVVAPSGYFPDPQDRVIRNLAAVFDENGELVGTQAKVVLQKEDVDLAQPGSTWEIMPTAAGRLGVILGADVLFPEVGRLLAYRGADFLAIQGACLEPILFNKLRMGALARMQENQLFAAAAFLTGPNRLTRATRTPFAGKSAIFAPQELTPRKSGVLVEMTAQQSEGVLAAVCDYAALRELWDASDTPLRRQVPLEQAGAELGLLYSRLEQLPRLLATDVVSHLPALEATESLDAFGNAVDRPLPGESDGDHNSAARGKVDKGSSAAAKHGDSGAGRSGSSGHATGVNLLTLDDLEVVSSVTSRWPLGEDVLRYGVEETDEVAALLQSAEGLPFTAPGDARGGQELNRGGTEDADETDEMDALPRKSDA